MRFRLLTGTCSFQVSHERRLIYLNGSVCTMGKKWIRGPLCCVLGSELGRWFYGSDSQWKIVMKPESGVCTGELLSIDAHNLYILSSVIRVHSY